MTGAMTRRRTMSQPEQSRPLLPTNDTESQHSERSSDEWTDRPSAARRRRILLKTLSLARPAHVLSVSKRFAYCFVPQLIRTNVFEDPAPKTKEFSTSYLNGLRGLTAIKVFTFHYFMVFTDATHVPYGASENYTHFTELPYIRYFWTGFTSHIFFGLAGYLTCQRLFILLDKNDQASQAKVLLSVSGSLFRRAFRLYLPVFLITLLMATYIHLGFYEANRPLLLNWTRLFPGDWNETKPEMFDTWYEQLQLWASEMYQLSNFMSSETVYPLHDQHLWSILAEMRASLHLHGIIIALAQVKRNVRLVCLCILTVLYLYWNHWEIWVYILGAIVAQIDQMLNENNSNSKFTERQALPTASHSKAVNEDAEKETTMVEVPAPSSSYWERLLGIGVSPDDQTTINHQALRFAGYLVAFYFLSYPIHGSRGDKAPGWETLNTFIPEWMDRKDKFYANWGTFILLLLLVRSNPQTSRWRKITNHPLPQYLGKISFACYLVQQIIQHAFGYMIPHHIWWSFGVEGVDTTTAGWLSAILIGWAFTLTATLWMADCWAREVEGRCIKFVKWIEVKCFR